ncbi:MAG TPA: proton-conducting transporter membrane subunit [Candidatus Paceibacterota bacterium]|nr:proton-conducting transporter membrane subunit [Verrucomicrobiota bacterium]HSA12114.1 proton-conducting transporter membrane subunit [Candidatus Paceibacterota bacterium]
MTPEQSVIAAIVLCMVGAVLTLLFSKSKNVAGWIAFAFTLATALMISASVVQVLASGPGHQAQFPILPQIGLVLRVYVDGLTGMFLLLTALISVPAALYSIVYMRNYEGYSVARYYPYFLLFLAAMYGLVSTTDMMWFFFIFWQMMTLPGYVLIRFEHRNPANVRAANKYLIMMQIACAATMIGAELLAVTGAAASGSASLKYDFDTVSANLPAMLNTRPAATALAFALFLVGFGIKMGMWPFGQFWLPDAHPAAPSPVSAMLSGVMIKTGVYGLMRYFLWLVPTAAQDSYPLAKWGLVVALLGTITLFTGTMQALKQEQSKRLLAFHSIGQIGYILLGTGACISLLPVPGPTAAALAAIGFFGALLHVLNHGLFKALLFLNAGSMLHATNTQDLNKMGGLMKFMPLTAITALVASFSISGVPLFNGFVSKWTIYVAAVQGSASVKYLVVFAVIAILTSALTLASFIKFFGVSFLSRTSVLVADQAGRRPRLEVGWSMQLPQVALALACVLLGVLPAIGFRLVQMALDASSQGYGAMLAEAAPRQVSLGGGVTQLHSAALFAPLVFAVVLGLMFLVARCLSKLGRSSRRAAVPWLCGYAREADCHRYSAHSFYGEIKRYFRWLGGAPRPPGTQPAPKP